VASSDVQTAVNARLTANWAATTLITPNSTSETPTDGSSFLTVQYPVANSEQVGLASVGNRNYREEGVIRLVLSVPRGQGNAQALTWCETLRTLFRGASFSGVRCWEASPPVENNDNEDGQYYVLSVSVPYYFDVIA